MKFLIIGSGGFIGSHLVEYFSTNPENSISGCDVRPNPLHPDFTVVDKFESDYESIFSKTQYDVCIYAGGNGSVPYSIENPEHDFHLNTYTLSRVLTAIRKFQRSCKFLHISSAAVYGSPKSLPITEQSPVQPLSPYGWHKYLSETLCREYHSLYKIPTLSMRVFSVYGERLQKQIFWDIYQKMLTSDSITLFGTGKESRDFINIRDFVRAVELIINKASFQGEVINVASGIETTIEEASTIMCRLYNSKININFNQETKPGDPTNWRADTGILKQFGFTPLTSLEQGLEKYVQWLKERE
ncbi:MAG: NAD-dependent epimerase/dehydratase family protein [Bacteroidetes bacterium]|nr:NAD-dependent epimerase/dehydratase family protein [Bacteroidota bacterium]